MDSLPKLDVVDWQDSTRPIIPNSRAPRRFLSPTLIGILGTLLLHAALIQSLPFGNRGLKVKSPEAQQSADALDKSKADSEEPLELIPILTTASSQQAAIQNLFASRPDLSKMKIKSPVNVDPPAILNIESLPLSENDQVSTASNGDGEDAEKARLFGIYTDQIQARVDRVWRRPRTPVNEDTVSARAAADAAESFQCEVQIVQDAIGIVQEILLPRCNGSSAWQRSLVLAIQQASPLPAPPSAKVFSRSITLNFVGLPYIAGSPQDEYEFEPRAVARSNF
ncbi:MAG: cell envelope integrity protein TolA [Pseudomonadota bacterium]|nr:cell envelope integrity protein TolA [Pseudomonadota bacterium]